MISKIAAKDRRAPRDRNGTERRADVLGAVNGSRFAQDGDPCQPAGGCSLMRLLLRSRHHFEDCVASEETCQRHSPIRLVTVLMFLFCAVSRVGSSTASIGYRMPDIVNVTSGRSATVLCIFYRPILYVLFIGQLFALNCRVFVAC